MKSKPFQSRFTRTFDVVIFGSGYSAFGAALEVRKGGRSVCLVNRQAELLWEGGRAYAPHAGASDLPLWRTWMGTLRIEAQGIGGRKERRARRTQPWPNASSTGFQRWEASSSATGSGICSGANSRMPSVDQRNAPPGPNEWVVTATSRALRVRTWETRRYENRAMPS